MHAGMGNDFLVLYFLEMEELHKEDQKRDQAQYQLEEQQQM